MSTRKSKSASIEWYLSTARALSKKRPDGTPAPFPSLKKYARRKKHLSSAEKAAITRTFKLWDISTLPTAQKVDALRQVFPKTRLSLRQLEDWQPPGRRKRTTKSYVQSAERLAPYFKFSKLPKKARKKKLTSGDKSYIRKMEKRARHLKAALVPLSKEQIRKLRAQNMGDVLFPIPGITSIKMRHPEDGHNWRVTSYGLRASGENRDPSVRRWYEFHYVTGDIDDLIEAAERLFERGAISVRVWLNHGMQAAGHRDITRFAAMLGQEEALEELDEEGVDTTSIVSGGYAVLYQPKENGDDPLSGRAEVPWILGVVGLFETHDKNAPPPPSSILPSFLRR